MPWQQQDKQQTPARRPTGRRAPTSEFQKIVFASTGQILPIIGAAFFTNTPSTFAPILNMPVPAEHPLGAGDELPIRRWGSIDIDYRANIDRNGVIAIPAAGWFVLGVAGDAQGAIRGAAAKRYKDAWPT